MKIPLQHQVFQLPEGDIHTKSGKKDVLRYFNISEYIYII